MDITLTEMIRELMNISDDTWGMYAFSREILKNRIPETEMHTMIADSISCGTAYADRILNECGLPNPNSVTSQTIREYDLCRPEYLADRLGLMVEYGSQEAASGRILFATFTPPDHITIMKEPLRKLCDLLCQLREDGLTEIEPDQLSDILIGHEIFHYLEQKYKDEIYTRTKRIRVRSLPLLPRFSTVRTLGEIAGMYFTKRINRLTFSPFLLDILAIYGYYPLRAEKLFYELMEREHSVGIPS